jgi:hypothetical protein
MDEESKKQLLQKKIFDNPELYMSTHVTFSPISGQVPNLQQVHRNLNGQSSLQNSFLRRGKNRQNSSKKFIQLIQSQSFTYFQGQIRHSLIVKTYLKQLIL